MPTIVDSLYKDIQELQSFLNDQNEISLKSFTEANLRKNLLLASASFFEVSIQSILESFSKERSTNCLALVAFVRNKGIKRQYHTYFNWDSSNANSFFGLFGEDFKESLKQKIDTNDNLKDSISAFIEIGRERNRLVHQDFGSYSLEKTADELFDLHKKAITFLEILKEELKNAT